MKYRTLGRTGLKVSEIGFGAWGIGSWSAGQLSYGKTDDETSLKAIHKALDCGVQFFDTSNLYGLGRSETLLGQALSSIRGDVVIATKAGYIDYLAPPDFSKRALLNSVRGSLQRLNTDYIDLLQLHGASTVLLRQNPSILDTMRTMVGEGYVRSFGLSAESPQEAREAIEELDIPVVQVNFNMLDLRAVDCGVFAVAKERNCGIIARTPLSFGYLTGAITKDTVFAENDHRSRWGREKVAQWVDKAQLALAVAREGNEGQSSAQLALRFCLSFAEVSTVIPGMLTADEAEMNASASQFGGLSEGAVMRIAAINATNYSPQ